MNDHSSPPKLIFLSIIDGEAVAAEVQNKRAGMGSAGRRGDIKHDEKKKKSWRKTEGEQGKEKKTRRKEKEKKREEGRVYIPDDYVWLLREAYEETMIEQVHMRST